MPETLLINQGRRDPRTKPLTERQAAILLDLSAKMLSGKDGRFDYYPGHDETKDALVRKGLVEPAANGRYGISAAGCLSLAAFLAWHVRVLDGQSLADVASDRSAA